jgi:hypothetical protein
MLGNRILPNKGLSFVDIEKACDCINGKDNWKLLHREDSKVQMQIERNIYDM